MPGQRKISRNYKWDLKKLASIGGKARARKLSKAKLSAIGRKGGLAARGLPRRKYKRRVRKAKK